MMFVLLDNPTRRAVLVSSSDCYLDLSGSTKLKTNTETAMLSTFYTFVPTKTTGVFGQWCRISGFHLAFTFVKLAGPTSEKQMRMVNILVQYILAQKYIGSEIY